MQFASPLACRTTNLRSVVFSLYQDADSTMMWKILSVCALFLGQVLAAVNYCNSNGDICARFEDGFNSDVLGEISEWWNELEKNVRPLKCEFSKEEDDGEREQVGYQFRARLKGGPQVL